MKTRSGSSIKKRLAWVFSLFFSITYLALLLLVFIFFKNYYEQKHFDLVNTVGSTVSAIMARPASQGDFVSMENYLSAQILPDEIISIKVVDQNGNEIASQNYLESDCYSQKSYLFPINLRQNAAEGVNNFYGQLELRSQLCPMMAEIKNVLWFLVLVGILILVASIYIIYLTIRRALLPLRKLSNAVSENSDFSKDLLRAAPQEIAPILEELDQSYKNLSEMNQNKQASEMARQLAHDIRSPLAALDLILKVSKDLPEERRLLIRNAITRVRDIANNLLTQAKRQEAARGKNCEKEIRVESLLLLTEELISEKRFQYKAFDGLNIELQRSSEHFTIFAAVESWEFKRILSNLINNSVEALPIGKGQISIHIKNKGNLQFLEIQDTGAGIPSSVIQHLGEKGYSYGKETSKDAGSGLGLYHAKKSLEKWGGRLEIESTVGKGSSIRLVLPQAKIPQYFASEIAIPPHSTLVALDDDPTVHQIWQKRVEKLHPLKNKIQLKHFSSATEFSDFMRLGSLSDESCFYLFDQELLGQSKNGLDLIEEFSLSKNSLLVTSHYDEPAIQKRCRLLGLKMIPKSLAAFVPLRIQTLRKEKELFSPPRSFLP